MLFCASSRGTSSSPFIRLQPRVAGRGFGPVREHRRGRRKAQEALHAQHEGERAQLHSDGGSEEEAGLLEKQHGLAGR